jgi:glutamine amidotransferase
VLDYGSGNLRSAERALVRSGADVEVTADREAALAADGLVVPGVGAFGACMVGLRGVDGPGLIEQRLAGGRPVLGICVGMQVLFEASTEPLAGSPGPVGGCGQWPGTVQRLVAAVLPHMGWNTVDPAPGSVLFSGVEDQRFYFVHSYAVTRWEPLPEPPVPAPRVTWSEHGSRFVAAIEDGALSAVQFHPEKSGDAGAALLRNWLSTLV